MDLILLKLDKDLFSVELIKGLNYKEVTANGWTKLPTYKIPLSFDNLLGNFGVLSVNVNNKLIINGYIYILIELRGI